MCLNAEITFIFSKGGERSCAFESLTMVFRSENSHFENFLPILTELYSGFCSSEITLVNIDEFR